MYRIRCAEVWGGVQNAEVDACTKGISASLYSSSCEGGRGDVYYFSVCGTDALTRLAIADVMGHGERVSKTSQWLYDGLSARMNSLDGSGLLKEMNQLADEHGFEAMSTAAVLAYYTHDSNAYFSYAGHPPVLLRRRNDAQWQALELASRDDVANTPLGVAVEAQYDQQTLRLHSGDQLLAYTDGVVEAPNAGDELFGQARLVESLNQLGDCTPQQIKSAVLEALRRFTGGRLDHDDVTIMALEIL